MPPPQANETLLSRKNFEKLGEFITRELGIKMPGEKLPMLQSRLQRRLHQLEMSNLEEYLLHLFELPETSQEWTEFINLVTTNKTDFFREPKHFEYLVNTALPRLDPGHGKPWQFNLWCAGCSSGEEPYTLAMVLSEFGRSRMGFDFSILATDISTRVLELAHNAVYAKHSSNP